MTDPIPDPIADPASAPAAAPVSVPIAVPPAAPVGTPVGEHVRRHDPDRFLTALFAPPDRRDALLTLYAFDHELARARTATSEPHLAVIRLHWWREIVEGARRRHEIATPLGLLLDSGRLRPETLLPIIDAYETEAEPAIETLAAWRDWLRAGEGGLAVAAATLLADGFFPGPAPKGFGSERFRALGAAVGAARVIRGQRVLASRGRCLLPADLLAAEGTSVEAAIAVPDSPAVAIVLRCVASEGLGFLAEGPRGRVPRPLIAAALPAVLARRDLRRGAAADVAPRAFGDRLAVTWAALTARI